MNRIIAPYGIRFQENGRVDVFPAIEILVHGKGNSGIRALFHVDSGATTSILPLGDAAVLGVSLRGGKRIIIRGIGQNTLLGVRHTITIEFERKRLRTPAIFAAGEGVPRILGREGVFRRFGILFDESKQRTLFLDSREERAVINTLFPKS